MDKLITGWNSLPEDIGKIGKAFRPYTDYIHNSAEFLHTYASILGLAIAIVSFFFKGGA